jgi:hypothetical protein
MSSNNAEILIKLEEIEVIKDHSYIVRPMEEVTKKAI